MLRNLLSLIRSIGWSLDGRRDRTELNKSNNSSKKSLLMQQHLAAVVLSSGWLRKHHNFSFLTPFLILLKQQFYMFHFSHIICFILSTFRIIENYPSFNWELSWFRPLRLTEGKYCSRLMVNYVSLQFVVLLGLTKSLLAQVLSMLLCQRMDRDRPWYGTKLRNIFI